MGGILTLQTPDQVEPRGVSGLKVKQPLPDKFPCPRGEIDRFLQKIGHVSIRAREDHMGMFHKDFEIQRRGFSPIEKSHVPLKGRVE